MLVPTNVSSQLFMPAGSDPDSVKTGGLASQVLGNNATVVEFPTMRHGWTARGDIKNPEVEAEVKMAMTLAARHFVLYVK